jgi:hypothetical protein
MGAGLLRFSCILLALLALLNARLYSDAEIRAMDKFQKDEYGSNYFPGLQTCNPSFLSDPSPAPGSKTTWPFF